MPQTAERPPRPADDGDARMNPITIAVNEIVHHIDSAEAVSEKAIAVAAPPARPSPIIPDMTKEESDKNKTALDPDDGGRSFSKEAKRSCETPTSTARQNQPPLAHPCASVSAGLKRSLPAKTGIGNTLPVFERPARHQILPSFGKIRFDHHPHDPVLARSKLVSDVLRHLALPR